MRHESVSDPVPVGMQVDGRDEVDEQREPAIAEDALDRPERQRGRGRGDDRDPDEGEEGGGDVEEEVDEDAEAASAATATGRGKRSLTRSKLAFPATAATRPDISAKTMMPTTPMGTAQSNR
jgi:hypothetical protein